MADFANWMIAVEAALGWPADTFLQAMFRNESEAHETAIADSPLAQAVRSFIIARQHFEGSCTDLLDELTTFVDHDATRSDRWPKDQRSLSQELRERAPNLRAVGVEVEFHDNKRPKRVTLNYARPNGGDVAMFDATAGTQETPPRPTSDHDDDDLYFGKPVPACFGYELAEQIFVRVLLTRMTRFWSAALSPPVAPPPLDTFTCDGTQVPCL
jgi:hypothetical protein